MQSFAFGVHTTPPLLDPDVIMQRADEIGVIQRLLTDVQTNAVILVGAPGVGKSTLAALIYHRLLLAQQANMSAPRYLVWLTVNSYTTLADILAAILQGVEVQIEDFSLLPLEQQIPLVQRALQQPQRNALLVLNQFESLLHPGRNGNGMTPQDIHLFLSFLQADLGSSRFLLTSATAPFDEQQMMEQTPIRVYLVSRISIPEGIALLQQRGIMGTPEEVSLVWQRCGGHVFALLLFGSLVKLSGIALGYLLLAPEHQSLWSGNIASNILTMLYQYLPARQKQVLRCLSLFSEPVSLQAIAMTITSGNSPTSASEQFYAHIGQELQTLIHLNLVQSVQDNTLDAFFSLHPLLCQFVQEHYLEEIEQQEDAYATQGRNGWLNLPHQRAEAQGVALAIGHAAVANYYYMLAQQQVLPQEQRTRLQDIEPLLATIRHLCLGQRWQQACDLLFKEGLHESLVRWHAWYTLIALYTMLLPPLGVLSRRDEGLLSSHLAMVYGRVGNKQKNGEYLEQALNIQHETEDTLGEAVTLANQGELSRMGGEREQAHIHFEKALLLSRQQPDQQRQQVIQLQCIILHNMGLLYYDAKDYGPALSCYLHALRLTYKLQEQHDRGTILTNLGLLLYEQGQQLEGIAVLLAALQLRKSLLDPGVVLLERFFVALEQRIGSPAYASLYQSALGTQQQILAHLMQVPA
ncbi:MAG: hypothetical protein PVS3B3_34740 [Ktedonobacteraceae bacterium]